MSMRRSMRSSGLNSYTSSLSSNTDASEDDLIDQLEIPKNF